MATSAIGTDDDARWHLVRTRDRAASGAFVFAVRSTGIYCRPGCPSRTPARRNVSFHLHAAAAEAAGFRPCKRCAPDGADADDAARSLVRAACERIDAAEGPLSLADLADGAGLSRFHFHRLFKRLVGVTPAAYVRTKHVERLRAALVASPSGRVIDAIFEAGFGSGSQAYGLVDRELGMTPGAIRARGAGETLRFAIAATRLGALIVARTERGLCAVELAADAAAAQACVAARYPRAERIVEDEDDAFRALVACVAAALDDGRPVALDGWPLAVVGTAFQRRVWEALRAIPRGETRTYGELAATLGRPAAARAVAGACAANPLAVVVPCHRVRRDDGGLGGYRWGLERKRALLDGERKHEPLE